ncbi:MAG TPA: type II toxin-antitoxin system prevent-host-death family antitoxin [Streptosporangiaceae bacterium]|jgi:antitoxin (DNA-binding transcriptional repressor) of toxin-antitoxin stability system
MPAEAHAVGLRELRHRTSEVLARVRHGETIDVTEHGRLIARRRAKIGVGSRTRRTCSLPSRAELDALVTYEDRLGRAAGDAGLVTVSPRD